MISHIVATSSHPFHVQRTFEIFSPLPIGRVVSNEQEATRFVVYAILLENAWNASPWGWLRADRERGINFWASIPFLIRTPEINRVDFIFSQDLVKRFRFRFENWKASSDRGLDIRSTEKSTRSMTSERLLTGSIGESSRDNCDNRRDAPQRDV